MTSPFDDDLYFEILKSERIRVRALMGLFGGLFVASLALAFVVPSSWNPIHRLGPRSPMATMSRTSSGRPWRSPRRSSA